MNKKIRIWGQKIEIMQIRHDLFSRACQIRYSISAIYIRYENAQIVTIYNNYSLSQTNANGINEFQAYWKKLITAIFLCQKSTSV